MRVAGGFSHWELARGWSRAEALCPGMGPHAPAVSSRAPAVPGAVPRVLSLCPAWGQSISCNGASGKGIWLCCAAGTASPSPLSCHGSGDRRWEKAAQSWVWMHCRNGRLQAGLCQLWQCHPPPHLPSVPLPEPVLGSSVKFAFPCRTSLAWPWPWRWK